MSSQLILSSVGQHRVSSDSDYERQMGKRIVGNCNLVEFHAYDSYDPNCTANNNNNNGKRM